MNSNNTLNFSESCRRSQSEMKPTRVQFDSVDGKSTSVRRFATKRSLQIALVALASCTIDASAQVPINAVDYTRTDDYTYTAIGQVLTHVAEPLNAPRCNVTTYGYDAQGNQTSSKVENCSGAADNAVFQPRNAGASFPYVASQGITTAGSLTPNTTVSINAGIGATSTSIGAGTLLETSAQEFDPRFGIVTKVTDPNSIVSKVIVDDFGREIRAINADGTYLETHYCYLGGAGTASNSANCPTPALNEAPTGAVMFTNVVKRTATGVQMTAYQRVFIDRLGRTLRTTTQSFDGLLQPAGYLSAVVASDQIYNAWGLVKYATGQYFLSSGSATTTGSNDMPLSSNVYDRLGRVTGAFATDPTSTGASRSVSTPFGTRTGAWTTFTYAGLTTITTNDKGLVKTEERNALGLPARVTDNAGAQLAFAYDGFGNLLRSKDALANVIDHQYDLRGAKRSLADPDKGTWTYDVNALGELVQQQSPKQTASTATKLQYDGLGRLIQRSEPEFVSTWTYDAYTDGPCNKGIGRLCQTSTTAGVNKRTAYDNLGRPTSTRVDIALSTKSFAFATTYDATTGRVATSSYPTGLTVWYSYTGLGTQEKLVLKTQATGVAIPADTVLWQAATVSADGRLERATLANGVSSVAAYEAGTGRVVDLKAGRTGTELLNHHYAWDSIGNLTLRIDNNGDGTNPTTEAFSYDDLNRLVQYRVDGTGMPSPFTRSVTLTYNALGMLLYKSDVGAYTYGPMGGAKPHALTSLALVGGGTRTYGTDAHGNVTSASSGKYASIAYTSFDLPDGSTGVQGPAGSPTYAWSYDERHARIKQTKVGAGNTRTTFYLHPDLEGGLAFESENNSAPASDYQRHFLTVGGTVVGVLTSAGAVPSVPTGQTAPVSIASIATAKMEYWHTDHLGSVAATSDQAGALQQRYSYDPFGKRRFTSGANDVAGSIQADWKIAASNGTGRGFTGHEELDDVGLVHMNGRVYDDELGLFVQADPSITDLTNLQNYNRYAYVLNNPLNSTDPSGFDSWGGTPEGQAPYAPPTVLAKVQINGKSQDQAWGQEAYDGSPPRGTTTAGTLSLFIPLPVWKPASTVAGPTKEAAEALHAQKNSAAGSTTENGGFWAGFLANTKLGWTDFVDWYMNREGRLAKGTPADRAKIALFNGVSVAGGAALGPSLSKAQVSQEAAVVAERDIQRLWTRTEYKGVRVYQRNDLINPQLKDARNRTNLERMQQGLAPIGPDGKSINLHHMLQTADSPLAEATTTFHQQNSKVLHINPPTIRSGIDRDEFDAFRRDYWINRAKDFMK